MTALHKVEIDSRNYIINDFTLLTPINIQYIYTTTAAPAADLTL